MIFYTDTLQQHNQRFSLLTAALLSLWICLLPETAVSQVTVGFQGGEVGDSWGYTSSGASAIAIGEAVQAPNKVTGTTSLVAGGNTGGGSCFSGGSGNGPDVARQFTFNSLDISSSNNSTRTLTLNWGNRYPVCNGTGWDSGENLTFRAYHDGVAQPVVNLANGTNNAPYSILSNQYTWNIPPCVNAFYFVISVTTNRADELLLIDNVKVTAPQLNSTLSQPSVITGPVTVCVGATAGYSVTPASGITYTWSGLPAGAFFATGNGTASATVNWGTAAPGTYTLTVTPSTACGGPGTPQTLDVTITPPPPPVIISGPSAMCAGETVVLTSSYTTGVTWSTGEITPSITVTAPGTYTVSVVTSCGTLTASHTVALTPAPVIDAVNVTNSSCFGANDGSVTIVSAETGLEYSADGINWQLSPVFGNLAPGTHSLYVRSLTGCSVQLPDAVTTEPAVVNAAASNTGPYCAGAAILLNASTTASGPVTYQWTGPNGYVSALQSPADATDAGVYHLVVSAGGCSSADVTTTVIVQALPDAIAANTGPYCQGQPLQLNGSTTSAGIAAYYWTGPAGFTAAIQNPGNASAAGTYELTVTVDGCQSAPVTTQIIINPLPDAAASYNAPFCTGGALQLNGSTTATGMAAYQWSGPNGYTSSVKDPSDATEAGTYTLVVTVNGCSSAASSVSVIPEVPAVVVSNTGPYCEGEPVVLSGASPVSGPTTYAWTGPAGYSSSLQSPADATVSGIYSLQLTVNGCSNTASTVVTIHPKPVAAFSSTTPCLGEASVFSSAMSTVTTPETIASWDWDFGDGTVSPDQHPEHVYAFAGTFAAVLKVYTASGCMGTVSHDVLVIPTPTAKFHTSSATISILDPLVQFANTSSNAVTYLWDFGFEDQVSTEESPEFTYPRAEGSYQVQLVAYNSGGCTDTARFTLTVIEELIYYVPNAFTPNGDEYNQVFRPALTSGFDEANYTLLIFNRWGEMLFESHDIATGWDGSYNGILQGEGAYTWTIRVKHRQTDAFETFTGQVTMLR